MVHTFFNSGMYFAVDCETGAIHVVDEAVRDAIDLYPSSSREELAAMLREKHGLTESEAVECLAEIDELAAAGKLFGKKRFSSDLVAPAKRPGVLKALCLHVAHTCNLDCEYCFASQGRYHGERALMSYETGCRALDFLIESSGDRHNLEVDFFGGEPLMNWETVKRLVAYGRKREKESGKHFRFTLTTNGMLVDEEVIDFTSREMDNVVMSLDGRKEVNDRFRKTVGGVGSFDIIVPKFLALQAARKAIGKEYYIRGTFTHLNPDFMKDIDAMLSLGFDRLSMEPVVCPPDSPYALTEEDLPVVMRQYELLAERMIEERKKGTPFVFYHYPDGRSRLGHHAPRHQRGLPILECVHPRRVFGLRRASVVRGRLRGKLLPRHRLHRRRLHLRLPPVQKAPGMRHSRERLRAPRLRRPRFTRRPLRRLHRLQALTRHTASGAPPNKQRTPTGPFFFSKKCGADLGALTISVVLNPVARFASHLHKAEYGGIFAIRQGLRKRKVRNKREHSSLSVVRAKASCCASRRTLRRIILWRK